MCVKWGKVILPVSSTLLTVLRPNAWSSEKEVQLLVFNDNEEDETAADEDDTNSTVSRCSIFRS